MQRALIACCCGKYFTKNQIEPVWTNEKTINGGCLI
jgi:hypothetical protein